MYNSYHPYVLTMACLLACTPTNFNALNRPTRVRITFFGFAGTKVCAHAKKKCAKNQRTLMGVGIFRGCFLRNTNGGIFPSVDFSWNPK